MKRSELAGGLQRVQGIVERRGTMPILSNILLEAKGETITLFATDLEIGMRGTHPARVASDGAVTVSARKLYEIIRELPEGDVHLATQENQWVRIECGRSEFRIMGLPPQEFPALPGLEKEVLLPTPAKRLAAQLKRTLFAVGESDARYILNGTLLKVTGQGKKRTMRLVGTDGHRLAVADQELTGPAPTGEFQAIIPKKAALEMKRQLEETEGLDGDQIELGFGKNQLILEQGGTVLLARLMEGNYPNYQQVIPKDNDKKALIPRTEFEAALRRVAILAREKTYAVKLSLEPGGLELAASNPDLGEAKEGLAVRYDGKGVAIGFNARYLLDVLAVMEGDTVEFEFKDALGPCVLRQEGDPDYLCVVMPMRL
jgi:DNA polymerase-3 subunit beta